MKFPEPKNKEEREALGSSFERIRGEWGFAPGFGPSKLLQHWQRFVQEVEEGYRLSIYDFTLDLEMRDLLEEIKEAVPLRLRQEIEMALRPWDERFRLATQPSDRPIDAGVEEDAKEWWFRIPNHAGPEVEGYLVSKGLIGHRLSSSRYNNARCGRVLDMV
jgi:hypothetical protein